MLKSKIDFILNKFGDDFEIVRSTGNVSIKGKASKIKIITNPWDSQYLKQGTFNWDESIEPGEILYDTVQEIYYFVYTSHNYYMDSDLVAQSRILLMINATCEIKRLSGAAGEMGGTTQTFISQKTGIRCHLREVNASLKSENPGFSETVSFILYIQSTESPVILDRIVIDSVNYQVDRIDNITIDGIYKIDLSLDKR
jgi:hypothetical protein